MYRISALSSKTVLQNRIHLKVLKNTIFKITAIINAFGKCLKFVFRNDSFKNAFPFQKVFQFQFKYY